MRGASRSRGRTSLAAAMLCMAFAGECAPAHAGSEAALTVRAVVPRHASVRMAQPGSLTLSAADIARGYVEVSAPIDVLVQSNVPEGYTLAFECHGTQVREVRVRGLHGDVMVGAAGALSARPATGRGMWRETLQLRLRFELAADARPGEHAWPLHVSMM